MMVSDYIEELELLTGMQSDDINFLLAILLKQSNISIDEVIEYTNNEFNYLDTPTLEEFLSGKEKL